MIAVLAYLGIAFPSAAIKAYYENYYAEYRLWDLEITSTLLMDEEDLAAVRAIPGVETAEGLYEIDAELPLDGRKEKSSVLALTTATGIALGLLAGNRIALGIVKLVEQPYLSFVREPDVRTFVFCGLITTGFSLAINGFTLRKIKNLKLSDAL